MSSRIHRGTVETSPFEWRSLAPQAGSVATGPLRFVPPSPGSRAPSPEELESAAERLAKEAYGKGFADGEAAGRKHAMIQLDSAIGRLGRTVEELSGMRERLRHEAEGDVVGLALAIPCAFT